MAWLCSEGPAARGPVDPHLVTAEAHLLCSGDTLWAPRIPIPHARRVTTNKKVHKSHLDSPLHCHKVSCSEKQHPDQDTEHGQHHGGC